MKKEKRFSRCTNFSCSDESKLIALVNKYQHIVVCKKTDEVSSNVKRRFGKKLEENLMQLQTLIETKKG